MHHLGKSFALGLGALLWTALALSQAPPPNLVVLPPLPTGPGTYTYIHLFDAARSHPEKLPVVLLRRVPDGVLVKHPRVYRSGGDYSVEVGRLAPGRYDAAYYDIAGGSWSGRPPKGFLAVQRVVAWIVDGGRVLQCVAGALLHHGRPQEIQRLDAGTTAGWLRTGETFFAFPVSEIPSSGRPVCRFYGLPSAGLDSHFFSADPDECAAVREKWHDAWSLETPAAFGVVGSTSPITCEIDFFQRVYRLYNNRSDANHRYTVSPVIRDTMIAQGWIEEGAQYDGSYEPPYAMCAPLNYIGWR